VLGTEAGIVTAIVRALREHLAAAARPGAVEIDLAHAGGSVRRTVAGAVDGRYLRAPKSSEPYREHPPSQIDLGSIRRSKRAKIDACKMQ